MEQSRKERLARNEATFRSINAALEPGLRGIEKEPGELAGFVCECGDRSCAALVHVGLEKYAEVRSDARRFLIIPGHDIPGVEDVVERGDRYEVVQKHEDVRHIVEAEDPRGGP